MSSTASTKERALNSASTSTTALRRVSDDPLLRPFLSSLFDSQTYVKTIIRDGKSEECLVAISDCTGKVNEEIQRYIVQHKDTLISGVQDVSSLANRYHALADHSKSLQTIVERLKRETSESYNLVKTRTAELEKIHETSNMLNNLKRFVKAQSQLDQYLRNPEDKDLRSLASAAKLVAELEKLIVLQSLQEITIVKDTVNSIKQFSNNIRMLSQSKLLEAVAEKNQAAIANYLQVFYNLESLPEVVLFVIDHLVRVTAEASRDALHLESLQTLLHDYMHKASTVQVPPSATKRPNSSTSAANASSTTTVTLSHLRIAIREIAHLWSTSVFNHATQVLVFQRVLMKKEDPTTHEKFASVLNTGDKGTVQSQLLTQGQLLPLFWHRLCVTLVDVCSEKTRLTADIAARAYPYLRRASVEVIQSVQQWADEDNSHNYGLVGASISLEMLLSRDLKLMSSPNEQQLFDIFGQDLQLTGMFGSLLWTDKDLFGMKSSQDKRVMMDRSSEYRSAATSHKSTADSHNSSRSDNGNSEHDLIAGLKPFRDLYLAGVLDRMNSPTQQMFPDLDGYIAAVPSKRDLQTLIKAIQAEFITAAVEGDLGLITLVAKEFKKIVQIMLTKIEGMIQTTPDSRKISSQNQFARTHHQEHNGLCYQLLIQFKEALDKIPMNVVQHLDDNNAVNTGATPIKAAPPTPGVAESAPVVANKATSELNEKVIQELSEATRSACIGIDELASNHILEPIVQLLAEYSSSLLVNLHKELVVQIPQANKKAAIVDDMAVLENSLAVQTLLKQMPTFIKSHLGNLPKSKLLDDAHEELTVRILAIYISLASIVRPANELTKLRAAKDLSALELALSQFVDISTLAHCSVMKEYKAFRRLLFEERLIQKPTATSYAAVAASNAAMVILTPPDRERLMSLEYVHDLRPSTVLGFLIASGPVQLPLPYDLTNYDLNRFVAELFQLNRNGKSTLTVRSLYVSGGLGWKKVAAEKQMWETIQQCLDIFFQRINVAEGEQKQKMRVWYELIVDIGSNYFK